MGTNAMNTKKFSRLFYMVVFAYVSFYVFAQETEPTVKNASKQFYYFEQSAREAPTFTQVLRWTSSPGVYYYEVEIKTKSGEFIFTNKRTQTNQLEVSLKPGKYLYRVSAYNMLEICEQVSDWISVEVLQARLPEIQDISPHSLYLDEKNFRVEVFGKGFTDDMEVYFTNKTNGKKIPIQPISIQENKIVFDIKEPNSLIAQSLYITVQDKSGLSGMSEQFIVEYNKPRDYYVGVSYTPWIPLYDKNYTKLIDKKFYPIAGNLEAGLIFAKKRFGFFGTELRGSYFNTSIKDSRGYYSEINNLAFSASILYEYWLVEKAAFHMTVGGGVYLLLVKSNTTRTIKVEGQPMYCFGLGIRIKPIRFLYIDVGASVNHSFAIKSSSIGQTMGILPEISIGFRY